MQRSRLMKIKPMYLQSLLMISQLEVSGCTAKIISTVKLRNWAIILQRVSGDKDLDPARLSKPVNTFLIIPILYEFLQSPLPTILHPAGFLKIMDLYVKVYLKAMLFRTGRFLT